MRVLWRLYSRMHPLCLWVYKSIPVRVLWRLYSRMHPLCLWVYKSIPARVWYNVKLLSFPFVFVGVFDGDMVKNGNLLVEYVKYSLYFEDIFSDILYFCISINPE